MNNGAKLDSWNAVKKGIDEQENRKKVEAQRIYWVSIGQNIGGEVYGKSGIFTRPVLVLNVFFNGLFVGVPLSSKVRNKRGKLCHKFKDNSGKEQLALLGQIRVYDSRRKTSSRHIGEIDDETFAAIKEKIKRIVIG